MYLEETKVFGKGENGLPITGELFVPAYSSYILLHSLKEKLFSNRTKQDTLLTANAPTSDNHICQEYKEAATCTQWKTKYFQPRDSQPENHNKVKEYLSGNKLQFYVR